LIDEKTGWMISAGLHVGLATAVLIGLPDFNLQPDLGPPPIEIEFIEEISDTRSVKAPKPKIEPKIEPAVKPQPKAREVAKAAPPESSDADAVALPEPITASPKPKPKPKISREEIERKRLRSKVVPRVRPKPPSRISSNKLAALLDRSLKEEEKITPTEPDSKPAEKKPEEPEQDAFASVRDRIARATMVDALAQKLTRCWSFPAGAKGIENFSAEVRIRLTPRGDLVGVPEVVAEQGDGSEFFRVYIDSALRAVLDCAPYREVAPMLKDDKYQIDFNFDGRRFGSGG